MTFFISTKYSKQMPFPEIGRWHIVFRLMPHWNRSGAVELVAGIFKQTAHPPIGEMLTSRYYKGFLFARDFHWSLAIAGAWNLPTLEELKANLKNLWRKLNQRKMNTER